MRRPRLRPRRLLAVLTCLALATPLTVTAAGPATAASEIRRLHGADRYATAVEVSRATHPPGVAVAVLTSGQNFPDALAGGPAAAALGGPVLLVPRDSLPAAVLEELRRLQPSQVLVAGGTAAVAEPTLDQLRDAGFRVQRLAGDDRFHTAALVSRQIFSPGTAVAYVATGADYPDALAGGAAAGRAGAPVLLTGRDSLPGTTGAELVRLQPERIVLLGGTASVSAAVERSLTAYAPTVERLSGDDRYATAAAVARATPDRPNALFLATGLGFADALAGGPAAAAAGAPVLLTRPTCVVPAVQAELERHDYPPVTLLGGPGALGQRVAELQPCLPAGDGELAPGVTLRTVRDASGPWVSRVLEVAPHAAWRLDTVLAQDTLPGLETTSAMARRNTSIAAVNGDFAIAGGRPLHAFARDGRLLQTSQDGGRGRNMAVESVSGAPHLGAPTLDVSLLVPATGSRAQVSRVNSGPDDLALTTVEGGQLAPAPGESCGVRLDRRGAPGLDGEGRAVQAYQVLDVGCATEPLSGSGDLLTAPTDGSWAPLLRGLERGQDVEVSWSMGWRDVLDAMGGNLVLMEAGTVVAANVDGIDAFSRRNPRTAVGYRPDGTVLIVTVDGRGAGGSVGMSLRELAELFRLLGASDALNLDGGGSSTMVVDGEVRNVPSDGPERPVSSALVVSAGSPPADRLSTKAVPSADPPAPLSPQEQAAAEAALLSDPGSTGGYTDHGAGGR